MSQNYNFGRVASAAIPLNNKIQNASNYLANKMPNVDPKHYNPIECLSIEEISYLQAYLQQVKDNKINQQNIPQRQSNRANEFYDPLSREIPIDWREFRRHDQNSINQTSARAVPGSRGASATRLGKKSDNYDYYNPYEYGAKQNSLPPQYKQRYTGTYDIDPVILNQMGINNNNQNNIPSHIRNINVETSLLQKEATHLPGQRLVTERELDRFEKLPFDPQNPNHLV